MSFATITNTPIARTINPAYFSVAGSEPAAPDDDLRALQQIGTKVRIARNTTIFNEGDDATYTYKIISGAVRLCKHTSNGRRQIADFLLAGDYFGVLEL